MTDFQRNMSLNPRTLTLLLPVAHSELREIDRVCKKLGDIKFSPKEEYHVTIIGKSVGQMLLELSAADHTFLHGLVELINYTSWFFSPGDSYHLVAKVKKENIHAKSIIVEAGAGDIETFYKALSALAGDEIQPPYFPHVTLYTHSDQKGIGVYDEQDFRNYVKREIRLEDLKNCED